MFSEEKSFLQSSIWGDFQKSIKNNVVHKTTTNYSYMGVVERGQMSNRLYCPFGPVVKDFNGLCDATDNLCKVAKQRKLDFIRIEPTCPTITAEDLKGLGYRHSHREVQPPATVVNDVSVDEDKLMAELSQTARRYARKCDKAGITYSVSYEPTDIKYFIEMIHEVAKRTGMRPHDDFYFQQLAAFLFPKKAAGLMFAALEGVKIASIIFYTDGTTMSYAHAANRTEYRKYSPATGLGLFALKYAHRQGCHWFDWYGIAPEHDADNPRYQHWKGFTQFKLSFSGQRVERLGTWEKPLHPVRYQLYRLLLKVTGR